MSFDNTDQTTTSDDQTKASTEDQAAGQTAEQSATTTAEDHTRVFLVAGDRAFRDANAAVNHIEHAQSHIATLEAERAADREKIATLEAEVSRLKKIEESLDGRNNSGNADQTEQLSKEELVKQAAALAAGAIKQEQTKAEQDANLAQAEAAAEKVYGESYATKVVEMAAAIGMSPTEVDALGKKSPAAFAKLFLPAPAEGQSHIPTNGSVRTAFDPAAQQQGQHQEHKNILKLNSRDRISHVAEKMKAAGVEGYN